MFTLEPVTPRVERLLEIYRNSTRNGNKPQLSAERARIITDFYRTHPAEHPLLKRAKGLKEILEKCTIFIRDDELLIGNLSPYYHGSTLWPELGIDWLCDELTSGVFESRTRDEEGHTISKEDKEYILSIRDFWAAQSVSARVHATIPDGLPATYNSGVISFNGVNMCTNPTGHFCANFRKVLTDGFGGIRAEAQAHLDAMEGHIMGDEAEKYLFYKAVTIVCNASIAFSKRYAALARKQAETAAEPRKSELLQIAETTDWIMEHPVRSYREAIQAVYMYELIMSIDGNYHGISIGRLDQYLWPYLEKDLASGVITMPEAQELMDCFFLKLCDMCKVWAVASARNSGGYGTGQHMSLGGQKADGSDATNPVSYLMLKTTARLGLHDPPMSVRVHKGTPPELWETALNTARLCGGIPTFQNDDVIIPALTARGVKLEDARDYCIIGCVEPSIGGQEWPACGGSAKESYFNLANALLLAINNGTNPMTGAHAGPETGFLYDMKSFDEVLAAYKKQIEFFVDWHISMTNMYELAAAELQPLPTVSATMTGCMESGRDVTAGGAKYNSTGMSGIGIANVADGLASIKYYVFDTRQYTAREMYDALMNNWAGAEDMHQQIMNGPTHFGNNIAWVDELARWATSVFSDRVNAGTGRRGGYAAGLFPVSAHIGFGKATAATPDGRVSGEPLSDGISPKQGCDKNGPVAILQSESCLEQVKNRNGTLLNMKFHPKSLEGPDGMRKVQALIQTYFDNGGMHLQYNVVSSDTLRAAQAHPEDYQNLVIRIAGFSAYFVELYKDLQDDLINRSDIQA